MRAHLTGTSQSYWRKFLAPPALSFLQRPNPAPPSASLPCPVPRSEHNAPIQLLVIGSSLGGPSALAELLSRLPATFPIPVVVVQHMSLSFTRFLAERLSRVCRLPVRPAVDGQTLVAGEIWIAPGDRHLAVSNNAAAAQLRLLETPPENLCRPSVDVLFRSAAQTFGPNVLALVMSGHGGDGLDGAQQVQAAGGRVWVQEFPAQDAADTANLIARRGLADEVLPLYAIAGAVIRAVAEQRPSPDPAQ